MEKNNLLMTKYMEKAFNDLKNKNLDDLSQSFKNLYELFVTNSMDNYVKAWVVTQAPISIINPHPSLTAFAANDGRIYINPAFINAIANYVYDQTGINDIEVKNKIISDAIGYVITHEMMHIMLNHPWTAENVIKKKVENIKTHYPDLDENTIFAFLQQIPNITMDYVINTTVCNDFFSDVINQHFSNFGDFIDDTEALYKIIDHSDFILENMKDKLKEELKDIDNTEGLQNKTWDELFFIITKYIDVNKIKQIKKRKITIERGGGGGCKPDYPDDRKDDQDGEVIVRIEGEGEGQGKKHEEQKTRKIKDSHGNEIEIDEEDVKDITDGYLDEQNVNQNQKPCKCGKSDPENMRKIIDKIAADFANKVCSCGLGKGGILRTINEYFETDKRQLKNILSQYLKKVYGPGSSVIQSWSKPNRRNIDGIPGNFFQGFSKKRFVAFFDVSGSITKTEMSMILGAIYSLFESKIVRNITVHTFDDGLQSTFLLKNKKDIDKYANNITGGGGTVLTPAIRSVGIDGDSLVCVFTDSELFDDMSNLKSTISKVVSTTKNKVVWCHLSCGSMSSLEKIVDSLKNYIHPIVIDLDKEKIKLHITDKPVVSNKIKL